MIKNRLRTWWGIALIAVGASATGCIPDPTTLTFGLGYLLGIASAPQMTSETCYVNSVEVDCSTVSQ